MHRRSGEKVPEATTQLQEQEPPACLTRQANDEEESLACLDLKAAACACSRHAQVGEAGPKVPSKPGHTSHARRMLRDKQPVVEPSAAAHAAKAGRTQGAAKQVQLQQQLRHPQQQAHASPRRVPKRRRPIPTDGMQPEAPRPASAGVHAAEGALELALLPDGALDHTMSLLAAEAGGSCARSTCSWLRSAFDRSNTRLVLRGTGEQLLASFPARLLELVRCSPHLSSLSFGEDLECVTWPQVLEAGGPRLLRRLEMLTLERPSALDLQAAAACTRLQHLHVGGHVWQQAATQLQPLAARGGSLRRLAIHSCFSIQDFTPLAACGVLHHLTLGACQHLVDLTPLAACVGLQQLSLCGCPLLADLGPLAACTQLQQLRLSGSNRLRDLSPLAACTQLRLLHIRFCPELESVGPLAACVALQELDLDSCHQITDLAPLASCTALQRLDLGHCCRVADLGPLAVCVDLRQLTLAACRSLQDLRPLAACVALQTLDLSFCDEVDDLGPLAACAGLQSLSILDCAKVRDLSPLAACPGLRGLDLTG